ncbi:MAG: hypothetical protein AAF495_00745 [Pseudomonadota bacterium]
MRKSIHSFALGAAALGFLAAVTVGPQAAQASFSGDSFTLTSKLPGGPFVDEVEIGPGVEISPGDGTNLGSVLREGESVDCDNFGCVFTFSDEGLGGAFEMSNLDGPVRRELEEIVITGNLTESSEHHLTTNNENETSFARFSVDCDPFLVANACTGGTIVVTFILSPVSGGDPLVAIADLRTAVVAEGFDPVTEEKLTRRLDTATKRINNGNIEGAISRMNGFIQKVERGQVTGAIGPVGDALISIAQEIIGFLQQPL